MCIRDRAKTTKSQARTKRERSEFLWGWLFILPTTIGLIVLNIIPIFQTIYQSFFKTGDFGKGNIFIGLQNYQKVFADKEIWQALINTFKYAIVEDVYKRQAKNQHPSCRVRRQAAHTSRAGISGRKG